MSVAIAFAETALRVRPRTAWARLEVSDEATMRLALIPTAWGDCGVLWRTASAAESRENDSAFVETPTDALLCRLAMPGLSPVRLRAALQAAAGDGSMASEVLADSHGRFPQQLVPIWFGELKTFLRDYFSDALGTDTHNHYVDVWSVWRPRLDLATFSAFRQSVLDEVARIPRGEVRTYGQIARQLGRPTAARAVGAVMRTNPWPILMPCHRVIGASGDLTGYSAPGRLVTKKRLLKMERGEGME